MLSHLNKLLIDLKVIGRIEENGRISTTGRNQISLEQEGMFQALWRSLWGESRERAVEAVTQVISGVIDISSQLIESPLLSGDADDEYKQQSREKTLLALSNVSKDMHAATRGISNLGRTYANDAVMTAKLEQLIGDIDVHVQKIDQLLHAARDREPKAQLRR
jgi:hypothetical protein